MERSSARSSRGGSQELDMVIPMRTRQASEVIRVLAIMQARLQALNLPVIRLHSDRAKEMVSRQLADWLRTRSIYHTTSAGDESQGNGRAESEIGVVKNRIRTVMLAAKAAPNFWPLAAYHCGEERHRQQLQQFGIRLPPMVPFGTSALARTKRWHKRTEDDPGWSRPMQRIQVWGPAWQMSPSFQGILCGVRRQVFEEHSGGSVCTTSGRSSSNKFLKRRLLTRLRKLDYWKSMNLPNMGESWWNCLMKFQILTLKWWFNP